MRRFLVCIHDATPAYAHETRVMIQDLAPFLGRRLSFGVVPNWHGEWPLAAHPDYCRFVRESSEELFLHGYCHQRLRGWGPTTFLTEDGDEMNGLDPEETRRAVERGQRVFTEVFGKPAQGFLAPAWQRGHMRLGNGNTPGLEHVLGFFSLESRDGRRVPLATWSWDCGRWGWLGHVGHGIGWLSQSMDRGVPTLAIHPRDLERGFWPKILRLTERLLETGYEPSTPARLLERVSGEYLHAASECSARLRAAGASARPPQPWRRRKRATRPEPAGGAASEGACRGVREAKPLGESDAEVDI